VDNPVVVPDLMALRPLTDAEIPVADWRLGQAWRLLLSRLPALPAWVEADRVDVEAVRDVLVAAVLRVLDNPYGHRQESRTVDDRTVSVTIDHSRSTGDVYFSADELARLRPPYRVRRVVWTLPA
jgi:hypothetical protein